MSDDILRTYTRSPYFFLLIAKTGEQKLERGKAKVEPGEKLLEWDVLKWGLHVNVRSEVGLGNSYNFI